MVNPPAAKKLVALIFEEVIVPAAKLKIFEVPAVFAVVEYINGIVRVSYRKFVFVAFDVNPAAFILFVVMAFEA
jgi:hypothetical protein